MNGIEDHVHLVASIPAKIAVSRFVGQVKAVASTKFNKSEPNGQPFFWQEEYGAFTFDRKRLPNYISYVERQKGHHAQGTTIPILERTDTGKAVIVREATAVYQVEEAAWRRELEGLE